VYGSNTDFLNKLLAFFFFNFGLWRFISQKLSFYFSSLGFSINQVFCIVSPLKKAREMVCLCAHI
jgi:hypothetical protein